MYVLLILFFIYLTLWAHSQQHRRSPSSKKILGWDKSDTFVSRGLHLIVLHRCRPSIGCTYAWCFSERPSLLKSNIKAYNNRDAHNWRGVSKLLIDFFLPMIHTFSAFWLRSSVVSVLNCVNAVRAPAGSLTVHTNFLRVAVSCPQDLTMPQSP